VSVNGFCTAIVQLPSDNQDLINWLPFVALCSGAPEIAYVLLWKPFSAPYTRASIAARIWWIISPHNWRDSVAHRSSTLAFEHFNIFCSQHIPFFRYNHWSELCSALRDRFQWLCWLTRRENSHNARTAPITISSDAFSAAVFTSTLEESRIGTQLTARVLIIPWISYLARCHCSMKQRV